MPSPLPLGFSSLGCPALSLSEAAALARAHGLPFLELRALGGTTDLPAYFEAHPGETSPVPVAVVGTSLSLLTAQAADLEAFYRLAETAQRWGGPYLRIFGDGPAPFGPEPSEAVLDAVAALVGTVRAELARRGCRGEAVLEMHDVFSSSDRCLALNARLETPLPILWDSHHTWKIAGEAPAETWAKIGSQIVHIHYKDSVTTPGIGEGYHYVLPGAGEFPTAELRALLEREGYRGGLSLEWERLWHPDLADLAEVLPPFVRLFRDGI